MKKLLIALAIAIASTGAMAHGHGGYGYGYHHGGGGGRWVVPALIGGVIGGAIVYGASQPVYAAPAPVYVQPQPVYQAAPPLCTETLPPPPYGYAYRSMYDPNLGCVRQVLVPH